MADNVAVTAGSGTTIAADEVTDGTLGTVKVQYVKIMDGTLDGTTKATVGAGGLMVNGAAAENAAAAGNPVLSGGRYDSSARTLGNGDVGAVALSAQGQVITQVANSSGVVQDPVGKAEDAAHVSGDAGIPVWAVRRDAKAVGSGTDADYSSLNVNSVGDLRVDGGQAKIIEVVPTVSSGTAYTAADVVGGEQTIANAARASGAGGVLTGVTICSQVDAAASDFEIIFYESNPAGTYTDNSAFPDSTADTLLIVASVIPDTKVDTGTGCVLYKHNLNIPYTCTGSTSLFAVCRSAAYASDPANTSAFTFKYHVIVD